MYLYVLEADEIRQVLLPRLLRISDISDVTEDLESVHTLIPDKTYQQIIKDVARRHGHIPEESSKEQVETFEKRCTKIYTK
jgi:hypothetical protein